MWDKLRDYAISRANPILIITSSTEQTSQDVQDLARSTSAASYTQDFARGNASSQMFIDKGAKSTTEGKL